MSPNSVQYISVFSVTVCLICVAHCFPRAREVKENVQNSRPRISAKVMEEYLTRARITPSNPRQRAEDLKAPRAGVFQWLDNLIFGNSAKQPHQDTHHHHSGDDYHDDYYYHEDDCHHHSHHNHHHDDEDYHEKNNNRFSATNGQQGQSVSEGAHIQVVPLNLDGVMKPVAASLSSIPGVTFGFGFPFNNQVRDEEKKKT